MNDLQLLHSVQVVERWHQRVVSLPRLFVVLSFVFVGEDGVWLVQQEGQTGGRQTLLTTQSQNQADLTVKSSVLHPIAAQAGEFYLAGAAGADFGAPHWRPEHSSWLDSLLTNHMQLLQSAAWLWLRLLVAPLTAGLNDIFTLTKYWSLINHAEQCEMILWFRYKKDWLTTLYLINILSCTTNQTDHKPIFCQDQNLSLTPDQ